MGDPKHHIDWPAGGSAKYGYSSTDVMNRLGLTPRQLNYLVERDILESGQGSGTYRRWSYTTVAKLAVAKCILSALPEQLRREKNSAWTRLAEVVLAGPTPRGGWVRVNPNGEVLYLGNGDYVRKTGIYAKWNGELRVDNE